jgi:Mn-dependent DtxR family transcriptional regulator
MQGYLGAAEGRPLKAGSISTDNLAGELDMQDNMITSLAELLEERGLIDYHEWENRVKKRLVKKPR